MAKLKTGRHTSCIKEVRKSKKRKEHNSQIKNKILQLKRQFAKLVKNKDIPALKELLKQFYKTVDKAAKISFIHKNKAARLKSKLAKTLSKIT